MNEYLAKVPWIVDSMTKGDIRPYVYVRSENRVAFPGSRHRLDWFPQEPIFRDPLLMSEIDFAEAIYNLESLAFSHANMAMPRWVFYDCAVVPGFVAGFVMKTEKLPAAFKKALRSDLKNEWTPLSLFIIIPTMHKGEWVAHNLSSINSFVPAEDRLYGLGFLSKAFGLWYANVETCCGVTQWGGPALKLHSHFGHLEILTAYTPVHTHAKSVTYRARVNTEVWEMFFTREEDYAFLEKYEPSGLLIDPKNEQSMIEVQTRIQNGEGPFFLSAADISSKQLTDPLLVYRAKGTHG